MALQMLGITDVTIGKIYATHGKRFTKIMAFHCHLTGLAIGPLIKCWIAAKRGSRQSTLKFLFLDFLHQEGSFCVYAVCVCVCVCVSVVNTVCGGLKLTCFSCVIKSLLLRGTFYNEATSKSCRDKSNTSVHNVLDVFLFFVFV